MTIVVLLWGALISIIGVQLYSIMSYIRNGGHVQLDNSYSQETLEKTKSVIEAIETRKIKKHIIANSAPKYSSQKTLIQFENFLASELMKEILTLDEETYNG